MPSHKLTFAFISGSGATGGRPIALTYLYWSILVGGIESGAITPKLKSGLNKRHIHVFTINSPEVTRPGRNSVHF